MSTATTQFAQIEPTTRCNFTCGFCAGRTMRQGDLDWKAFERFLAFNPALQHIELQGEGEPLMHPRFFDMVRACRSRGIRVSIITNGIMLSLANVDQLIDHAVESVHVSLESADAQVFQEIRGGRFAKVVDGIGLLVRRRRQRSSEWPVVGFSVTVLRRTLDAISGIVALYKELDLDGGIGVQLLQSMSCYTERYDRAMLEQLVPADLWRRHATLFDTVLGSISVRADARSYYGGLFEDFDPASGKCPWLEKGAYLTIDGAVAGCCFIKNPGHAFGNIMVDSHEVIMQRRRTLSDTLGRGVIPSACSGCRVAEAVTRAINIHAKKPTLSMLT